MKPKAQSSKSSTKLTNLSTQAKKEKKKEDTNYEHQQGEK